MPQRSAVAPVVMNFEHITDATSVDELLAHADSGIPSERPIDHEFLSSLAHRGNHRVGLG